MNSVKWPLSPGVLIAQWIECRHSVWEAMALILIGDSNSFFVPHLCHVDPFIFTEFFCTFTYFLNEISLLGATYKTMRYELPLFFLVVKTNVNCMVVGSFIIQKGNNSFNSGNCTGNLSRLEWQLEATVFHD